MAVCKDCFGIAEAYILTLFFFCVWEGVILINPPKQLLLQTGR